MDYYHADIAPHLYYFDSITELAAKVNSTKILDVNHVKLSGPAKMKQIRREVVKGWAELFHKDMGFSQINS
jgi:hypothetical protein